MMLQIGWLTLSYSILKQVNEMEFAIILEIIMVVAIECCMIGSWYDQRRRNNHLPTATPAIQLTEVQRSSIVTAECV